mmetsp:Transcript_46379/g.89389  ORF Transcript_46379/g.89389 Transcript_46379/m.89389 type:complete len:121 (-) Transcript_46379:40-402(-)
MKMAAPATGAAMRTSQILLLLAVALNAAVALTPRRLTVGQYDCPLCVAEDNCHTACADVRSQNPGSMYCLDACRGANPDDTFGEDWFARADEAMKSREALDNSIKRLGKELASDIAKMGN